MDDEIAPLAYLVEEYNDLKIVVSQHSDWDRDWQWWISYWNGFAWRLVHRDDGFYTDCAEAMNDAKKHLIEIADIAEFDDVYYKW